MRPIQYRYRIIQILLMLMVAFGSISLCERQADAAAEGPRWNKFKKERKEQAYEKATEIFGTQLREHWPRTYYTLFEIAPHPTAWVFGRRDPWSTLALASLFFTLAFLGFEYKDNDEGDPPPSAAENGREQKQFWLYGILGLVSARTAVFLLELQAFVENDNTWLIVPIFAPLTLLLWPPVQQWWAALIEEGKSQGAKAALNWAFGIGVSLAQPSPSAAMEQQPQADAWGEPGALPWDPASGTAAAEPGSSPESQTAPEEGEASSQISPENPENLWGNPSMGHFW